MSLAIHLLGKPRIELDGVPADSPKGRKSWALLAYMLCSRAPVSRERIGGLLFSDADDPLGSLRWNLAELRRLLANPQILRGDPLQLSLPPGSFVDIRALESGTWMEASEVHDLGRDLLEGLDFPTAPAFEAWLLNERRRVAASAHAVLREAALAQLAVGKAEAAIDFAARLVTLDPLAEEHQALLIRSYAVAGDTVAASRQLGACVELFRRELGVDPGPGVLLAVHASPISSATRPASGAAAARAQLEAGEAAVRAGMLEPGLECLRTAILEAHASGDDQVKVRALLALGSALAHAGSHRRQEAAAALHKVIAIGERVGGRTTSAAAYRELAWLEVMAAHYGRAQQQLSRAASLAESDVEERAAISLVLGMCLTDLGRYGESIDVLEDSVELAAESGGGKQLVYSLSWLGRAWLLRGEFAVARRMLERAMALVQAESWIRVTALPESLLGEVEIHDGRLAAAGQALEHAFAMACRVGDLCFESLAARGLGILDAARGDVDAAVTRLRDARLRLATAPDYTWSMAYVLDALCSVAVGHGVEGALDWVNDLESMGGRTGMREFVAHAYLYRARLGEVGAIESARHLAAEIDNPALDALLRSPVPRSPAAGARSRPKSP
jgi:DNA-binding SARP family transcriptional activator